MEERRPHSSAPNVDFDWEERTFKAARRLWRRLWRRGKATRTPSLNAAVLADGCESFAALASIVAGEPLKIQSTAGVGGVRGDVLLLPAFIDVADSTERNRDIYVVRVCIGAKIAAQSASGPKGDEPVVAALETLRYAEQAVASLSRELPGFAGKFRSACVEVLRGRPTTHTMSGRTLALEGVLRAVLSTGAWPQDVPTLTRDLLRTPDGGPTSPPILLWGTLFETPANVGQNGPDVHDESADRAAIGTEVEIEVEADIRRKLLDPREDFNPILHTFEKVHTLDNHHGSMRYTDGSDELDEQLDALEEVDFSEVIRGGDPAESILRADVQFGGDIPDVARVAPGEQGISYDEWDARRSRYRRNWCTVYPTPILARQPGWANRVRRMRRRQIDELERRLRCHRSRLTAENRRRDGEEVDLDAVVRALASVRAGESSDDKLYIRQRRKRRDFATTVLVDISLSTDSWVANKRVLDIARESVLVLGEVSERLHDRLRVLAFASHTRNICRVWELHEWGESWQAARDRLGLLRPQGYTRIGPAIRHATADLSQVPADKRLLLLVSDGKPTDYDRYEGGYGMADIRQALREAARADIHAHALAIDSRAKSYLSATFGVGGWDVLADPEELPHVMTEVYGRLTER